MAKKTKKVVDENFNELPPEVGDKLKEWLEAIGGMEADNHQLVVAQTHDDRSVYSFGFFCISSDLSTGITRANEVLLQSIMRKAMHEFSHDAHC